MIKEYAESGVLELYLQQNETELKTTNKQVMVRKLRFEHLIALSSCKMVEFLTRLRTNTKHQENERRKFFQQKHLRVECSALGKMNEDEDILNDVLLLQEAWLQEGVNEGFNAGLRDTDAFELGIKKVNNSFYLLFCRNSLTQRDESWAERQDLWRVAAWRYERSWRMICLAGIELQRRCSRWKRVLLPLIGPTQPVKVFLNTWI
jgi:hypothetical protein